jgi:drug/metabolite transporter (DMT)-like permease
MMGEGWRKRLRYGLLFVALAAIWGGSFVAIDLGLETMPPLTYAGVRYALAGVVVLGYAVATTDRWRPRTRGEVFEVVAVGVLVFAGYHALLYLGEQRVSGGVAAIVVSLTPVLTAAVASAVLPDERVSQADVAGFTLGTVGVAAVALGHGTGTAGLVGVVLVLLGAFSFAVGAVAARPLHGDLPSRTVQGWAMLLGAVVLLTAGYATGESPRPSAWSLRDLATLAYLVLVAGVAGYLLYFYLLDRLGPVEINLVAYLEPVFATAFGWGLFGHALPPLALAGFATIALGFAVVTHHSWRRVVPAPRELGSS